MKLKILACAYIITTNFVCFSEQKTFLIFGGKTGWIGQKVVQIIEQQGHNAIAAESRLENRQDLEKEILAVQPNYIVNAAGVTGRPNVDWCEDHQQETIRANIIGALTLADVAWSHGIHMTNLGTGCIYEYDEQHPIRSGKGFKEKDQPNFDGSFYSKTKIMLESLLLCYPNVLNLRLRMPISSDFNPRNFVVKISRYQKVINVPNSVTILDDFLPLISQMAIMGLTGPYNFVNPGALSHNEILDLYKEIVDPAFTYANFTVEEQNKILKAKRSNNELDMQKLLTIFPSIPSGKQSIMKVMEKMKALNQLH